MPNGNIRAYQADKPDKRGVSEVQFTNPENESPTVIVGNAIKIIDMKIEQVGNLVRNANWRNPQRGRIYKTTGISPALNTVNGGGQESKIIEDKMDLQQLQGKKFRIRKLTPRECFRLMGVDDADIDKMQAAGISNSAQYKLAGNSIVVDVLYHLFRKMFVEKEPDVTDEPTQLKLF